MRYKNLFYPLALATSLYSASPVFGNDAAPGKAPSSRAYEIECNLKRAEQGKIRLEDVFSEGFEKPGKPENVFKHRTEDHRTIEARLVKTSYDGPSSTYTETLKTPANDVEGATRGYQYKVDGFLKEILERDPKALESLGTILTKTHKVDKDRTIIENLEDRYRLNGTEECWKEYFDEYRAETPDDQESSKGFNEYLTSIVRFTRSLKILRDERDKLRKGDYAPFTRSGSGEEFDARYNNVKNGLNDEVVAFFDELLAGFNIDDLKLNIGNIEKNIQERATQIKAAEQSKKNCSYNIIQHGSEKTRLDRETNESKDRDKKPMENIKRLFGGRNESEYRDQLGVQKVKVGNLMAEENVKQEQAEKDLNDHTKGKEAKEKELAGTKKRLAEEGRKKEELGKKSAQNPTVSRLEYFFSGNFEKANKAEAVLEERFYDKSSRRMLEIYKLVFEDRETGTENIRIPYVRNVRQSEADMLSADPELLDYGIWKGGFGDQKGAIGRLKSLIDSLNSDDLRRIETLAKNSGYFDEENRISSTKNNRREIRPDSIKPSIKVLKECLGEAINVFIEREPNEKRRAAVKEKVYKEWGMIKDVRKYREEGRVLLKEMYFYIGGQIVSKSLTNYYIIRKGLEEKQKRLEEKSKITDGKIGDVWKSIDISDQGLGYYRLKRKITKGGARSEELKKLEDRLSNEGLQILPATEGMWQLDQLEKQRGDIETDSKATEGRRQEIISDINMLEKWKKTNEEKLRKIGERLEKNPMKDYMRGKKVYGIMIDPDMAGLERSIRGWIDEGVKQGKYPKKVGDEILEEILKEHKYQPPHDKKPIGFMDLDDGILKDSLFGHLSEDGSEGWLPVSEFPSSGSLIFTKSDFQPFKL